MTESRSPSSAAIALVVIAAAVVLGGGLLGGRQTTGPIESAEFIATDQPAGTGVVIAKMERGGFGLLGLDLSQPGHYVRVTFTVPAECELGDTEQWPVAGSDCSGPAGLAGLIVGSGRTATGAAIVSVEVSVDAACYGAVELGATWPVQTTGCEAQP